MMTKGPWKMGGKHTRAIYSVETGREVCKVHYAQIEAMSNINFNEESDDNARAIAQVPAMVEALRRLASNTAGEVITYNNLRHDARAILRAVEEEK